MESEKVLLKVSPMKGMMRFGKKGKLNPRYIIPFKVLEKFSEVAYRLALRPSLSEVHQLFHVSMVQKYYEYKSYVLDFISVQFDENLAYKEVPMVILDSKVQKWRSKEIASVKV
ncbi:PREDICTED: uncharacterized protein LOC109218758 [Nicotiana attenuata]|uniref:uncharacterized protein LOC109218758 n=1 Tax=Nicotiana attenuata TaxID=49451 RepID=UPI000904C2AE|nr:PREDICTED: uncharacterized protein LOC109218758 [Nicotiana attenuata]